MIANTIPFLDTKITWTQDRFETTIYIKNTRTDLYIHYWTTMAPATWKRDTLRLLIIEHIQSARLINYLKKNSPTSGKYSITTMDTRIGWKKISEHIKRKHHEQQNRQTHTEQHVQLTNQKSVYISYCHTKKIRVLTSSRNSSAQSPKPFIQMSKPKSINHVSCHRASKLEIKRCLNTAITLCTNWYALINSAPN